MPFSFQLFSSYTTFENYSFYCVLCSFVATAVGTVYERNQLDGLFLQALADSVLVLLAEILCELEYDKQQIIRRFVYRQFAVLRQITSFPKLSRPAYAGNIQIVK